MLRASRAIPIALALAALFLSCRPALADGAPFPRGYDYDALTAAYAAHDYLRALGIANLQLTLDPTNARSLRDRAIAFEDLGRYRDGLTDANAAVDLDANDPRNFEERADLERKLALYEPAIRDYEHALDREQSTNAELGLVLSLQGAAHYAMTRTALDRFVRAHPTYAPGIAADRVYLDAALDDPRAEIADIDASIEPSDANEFLVMRAQADRTLGDRRQELADYERAFSAAAPTRAQLVAAIAAAQAAGDRTARDRLIDLYRGLLQPGPDQAYPLVYTAEYALDAGDAHRARSDAAAALAFDPKNPAAHFVLGEALEALASTVGELRGALQEYTRAIDLSTSIDEAYSSRAFLAERIDDYDTCIADASHLIERGYEPLASYYTIRAECHVERSEYAAARPDLERAVALDPHVAAAHRELAYIAYFDHDYRRAVAQATIAIAIDEPHGVPTSKRDNEAYIVRGFANEQLSAYDAALHDATSALAIAPDSLQPFLLRGLVESDRGENTQAIANLHHYLHVNRNSVWALGALTRATYFSGRYKAARAYATRAIDLDHSYAYAYGFRASAEHYLGRPHAQLGDALIAIREDPKSERGWRTRADAEFVLGRYDEAIVSAKRAIALDDSQESAFDVIAGSAYYLNRPEEAARAARRAIALEKTDDDAYTWLGGAAYARDRYAEAIKDETHALRLAHDDEVAFRIRGAARYARGDDPGAIADETAAIRLQRSDVGALERRGAAELDLGRDREALEDFDRAIARKPSAFALRNRAQTLVALHAFARARSDATRAIALDDGSAIGYATLGDALAGLHDRLGALKAYRAAGVRDPGSPAIRARIEAAQRRPVALVEGDLAGLTLEPGELADTSADEATRAALRDTGQSPEHVVTHIRTHLRREIADDSSDERPPQQNLRTVAQAPKVQPASEPPRPGEHRRP